MYLLLRGRGKNAHFLVQTFALERPEGDEVFATHDDAVLLGRVELTLSHWITMSLEHKQAKCQQITQTLHSNTYNAYSKS